MQNPFNHENYPSNELKRNTFPCSFQNNLTMKYGYIYPAGIWRTVPGATYKIRPTLGLNFMPTTFPVQTRQKVYVHYFYGRDRNFWKDYKDFINGQRPDLVKPYIDESITKARTGMLLDYLGVPTTLVGQYGNELASWSVTAYGSTTNYGLNVSYSSNGSLESYLSPLDSAEVTVGRKVSFSNGDYVARYVNLTSFVDVSHVSDATAKISFSYKLPKSSIKRSGEFFFTPFYQLLNASQWDAPLPADEVTHSKFFYLMAFDKNTNSKVAKYGLTFENGLAVFSVPYEDLDEYNFYLIYPYQIERRYVNASGSVVNSFLFYSKSVSSFVFDLVVFGDGVRDIDFENSPYYRAHDSRGKDTIKLTAYLPRFYETVYNLYYRNPQNNPYILNGKPEYNIFIPTKDGGIDRNLYQLRRRNWEDDFLTTAVQSPQQGIAPLVGLTDRGATLTLTNDDGSVTRYNVTTTETGSITAIEANDTSAEPLLTKALIDAVSYGISIEDIRNVNAMQKWLELNLRKGYQYKDIIQARWGISISYNELDLPEFIGGFSKDVELQAVTQTANVNDDVTGQLGWQAGRLYAQGTGREITHYCDEEGYIMCLITVVPVPNYSQLLPKHWIERDLLDSYQPEFNHIGFQPITYKEVCPVQAFQESTENVNVLEQVFGYQRPWYQYFNYTDEVHGQFRTTFKDFLINRVFNVKPELSESFLLVDPDQINDVFNVPDVEDDKIIGAIYHNCVAKLPISLYAQARLE